jgi:hypothetical protein
LVLALLLLLLVQCGEGRMLTAPTEAHRTPRMFEVVVAKT